MQYGIVYEWAVLCSRARPYSHSRAWPVLDRLCHVRRSQNIAACQVRNGAGQFQRAMEGAGTQVQLLHGRLDQGLRSRLDRAVLSDFLRPHLSVAGEAATGEPLGLNGSRRLDPRSDRCR
jgi:hypothetical protein